MRRPLTDDPIPGPVRRLLERHFRSLSQVEAFVLLVRVAQPWAADAIAVEIGLGLRHVEGLLDDLVAEGLVNRQGDRYEVAKLSTAGRRAAEDLAQLYATYRLRIMDIVLSAPSDQARHFADAFRLRPVDKRKDDD